MQASLTTGPVQPTSYVAVAAAAFLTGLVQIPWHEAAHWIACRSLDGSGCALWYNLAFGRVAPGIPRALHAMAGPLLDLLTAGVIVLLATTHRFHRWSLVFLATAMMIAFRPVALLTLYIVRGDWRTRRESYDEVTAAIQLHLWPPSVALVSAVVAVICCVLVARQSSRRSVASCVIVTGIAGAPAIYTWLHLLGPRLMPWR